MYSEINVPFSEMLAYGGYIWRLAPLAVHLTSWGAENDAKNLRVGGYFTHIVEGTESGKPAWAVYMRWSPTHCPKECSKENVQDRIRVK